MYLNNARLRMETVTLNGQALPVCVPLTPNRCWLTSPCTLIGPLAREEARRVLSGPQLWALLMLSYVCEGLARALRVDRVVFPGHDLLSTTLYGKRLSLITACRDALVRLYPDRAVIIRSQTTRPKDATVWPIRLIWGIEDVTRDWAPRRDSRRDMALLRTLKLTPRQYGPDVSEDRLRQCLSLYRGLYIDAYSAYNPDYTPQGLRALMHEHGVELHTLESDDGRIEAMCAARSDGDSLILPLVGYERDRPQADGLYRAVMAHMALYAQTQGLKLNLSAGAPHFKRHRGAIPCMEYLIIMDAHLPLWRRLGYRLIARCLNALEPKLAALAQA